MADTICRPSLGYLTSPCIGTASGGEFSPFEPHLSRIDIEDIALGLSREARFAGQSRQKLTVAEHCIAVASIIPRRFALWGLLHDASEAYMHDLSAPFKHSPPLADWRIHEKWVQGHIYLHFGCHGDEPPHVKLADQLMYRIEQFDLMPRNRPGFPRTPPPRHPLLPRYDTRNTMGEDEARERFLGLFYHLTAKRDI